MTTGLQEQPLPAEWSVREGRDAYLAENGFTVAAYDEKTTKATAYGMTISVPNTPKHRWAIMLHDLHHVATGFGTDPAGEGEISAWEAKHGLIPLGMYVGTIVSYGVLMGLALAPRRTFRAYRAADKGPSLFHEAFGDYESLLNMSIGELRGELGIPIEGLYLEPRRLHHGAPKSPLVAAG